MFSLTYSRVNFNHGFLEDFPSWLDFWLQQRFNWCTRFRISPLYATRGITKRTFNWLEHEIKWLDSSSIDWPNHSLEGLEDIHFTPFDLEDSSDTMKRLLAAGLSSQTLNQIVLEDYCHIPKEKVYWCKIGEEWMMAHEYIVFKTNEEDIFIPVCIYHFAFGLRFPLHPFFSQILCHFYLFLNQLLPQATRKIMSFIWTCEYMKLLLTFNLFKSFFKLDENKNKPLITFSSINGAMVVYPELNDLKEYKDKSSGSECLRPLATRLNTCLQSSGVHSKPERLWDWMKFSTFLEEKGTLFCTLLNQRTRICILSGFHML